MVFDVIVVGSGSAGLSAAITAAENGASTLMIEKNAELGGTSGWSVGSITTSASPHQRAADIYDTPDQHFSDMELFHSERLKGRDNIKLRRLLVDNTPPTFNWLLSLELVFYGPMPEPPHTQPRMHNILPNSRMLIHQLSKAASKVGVEIRPSTALEDLLVEQGRVTGIVANGEKIRARRGVILAAGDFSSNDALKKRYMPANMARIDGFNPASTGDWHDPVTALGGRILNGDVALGPEIRFRPPSKPTLVRKLPPWRWLASAVRWSIDHVPSRLLRPFILGFLTTALMPSLDLYRQGALLINRRGERFSDETANPSDHMPDQPDGEAFVVMDGELAKAFQAWPNFISTAPGIAYAYLDDYRRNRPDIFFRASSLAELASKTGMDPAKLEEAVTNYNAKDAGGERRRCVTPPFVALGPVQSYIMTSDGGLAVNENLQVLGKGDLPIPGLYAAGSTGQGGLLLEGHGHHLGWGFTSGRIAGRHAALTGQNDADLVAGQP